MKKELVDFQNKEINHKHNDASINSEHEELVWVDMSDNNDFSFTSLKRKILNERRKMMLGNIGI